MAKANAVTEKHYIITVEVNELEARRLMCMMQNPIYSPEDAAATSVRKNIFQALEIEGVHPA